MRGRAHRNRWLILTYLGLLAGPSLAAELPDLVAAARLDAAQRWGVEAADVTIVLLAEATWPNTALGLPTEGRNYAQVLVPGHRVVFGHRGEAALYHTGDERFARVPGPERVEPQDLLDLGATLVDRLIDLRGELRSVDDRLLLTDGALRLDDRWLTTSAEIELTGEVAAAWRLPARQVPRSARVLGLVARRAEKPAEVVVRALLIDAEERPLAAHELLGVEELLRQGDRSHGRLLKVVGPLVAEAGGAVLRAGEARLWLLPEPGVELATLTGRSVRLTGLFERRRTGRTPAYGPGGEYPAQLRVVEAQPIDTPPAPPAPPAPVVELAGELPPAIPRPAPPPAPLAGQLIDGVALVPLRELAEWVGLTVTFASERGLIRVVDERSGSPQVLGAVRLQRRLATVLRWTVGPVGGPETAPAAIEQLVGLPLPPRLVAGRVLVPLEFVEAALGLEADGPREGRLVFRHAGQTRVVRLAGP